MRILADGRVKRSAAEWRRVFERCEASDDGTARLWDARTRAPRGAPMQHENDVNHAEFSADGALVVTVSAETARLWEVDRRFVESGRDLLARVRREKLHGVRELTEGDEDASPILRGRRGEDVCAPPNPLRQA